MVELKAGLAVTPNLHLERLLGDVGEDAAASAGTAPRTSSR
jgi:hypothetical protein